MQTLILLSPPKEWRGSPVPLVFLRQELHPPIPTQAGVFHEPLMQNLASWGVSLTLCNRRLGSQAPGWRIAGRGRK